MVRIELPKHMSDRVFLRRLKAVGHMSGTEDLTDLTRSAAGGVRPAWFSRLACAGAVAAVPSPSGAAVHVLDVLQCVSLTSQPCVSN